ncbi:MAG: hypothetical protein ACHP9Y_05450 [Gammaproteobacteria bacterium]
MPILVVSDVKNSTETQFSQWEQALISYTDSASVINKLDTAIKGHHSYQILVVDDQIKEDPLALIHTLDLDARFSTLMKVLSLHPKDDRNKQWFDHAREIGCFDFIQKPLLPSELDKKMMRSWQRWQALSI